MTSLLAMVINSPAGLPATPSPLFDPLPFSSLLSCILLLPVHLSPLSASPSFLPPPWSVAPYLLILVSPPCLLSPTLRDLCCMWRSRRVLTDRVPTLSHPLLLPCCQPLLLPSINPAPTCTKTDKSERKPCCNHIKTHKSTVYSVEYVTWLRGPVGGHQQGGLIYFSNNPERYSHRLFS